MVDDVIMPTVQNAKLIGQKENRPNSVYVGRPSKWGNPYHIGSDGNRHDVIELYRIMLMRSPELLQDLHELKGKDLICWCAPFPCHADILLELANKED